MPEALAQALQDARNGVLEEHLETLGRNAPEMRSIGLELDAEGATPAEVFLIAWYLGYVGCVTDQARTTVSQQQVEALVEEVADSVRSPLRRRRRIRRPGR